MIITITILLLLAGLFNGAMDSLQFHYDTSFASNWKESFWNPQISHRRKWKNGRKENGPVYWGSATFLVFTTDGWHLAKALYHVCLRVALVVLIADFYQLDKILYALGVYALTWAVQTLGFHLLYTLITNEHGK